MLTHTCAHGIKQTYFNIFVVIQRNFSLTSPFFVFSVLFLHVIFYSLEFSSFGMDIDHDAAEPDSNVLEVENNYEPFPIFKESDHDYHENI